MFAQLLKTYKDAVIYSFGNLANKIVGFLLLPLYTHYLPLSEYGVLGLVEPFTQLLFTSLGLGMNSAYLRWYSIVKDSGEKKEIFFNSNIVIILNALFFLTIFIFNSEYISIFLFESTKYGTILKISFFNVFFLIVNPLMFSTLRIEGKALQYSVIRLIQFVINLILNIYLIVYLEYGLISIFISQLVSSALVFIYFIPAYIRLSKIRLRFDIIKQMISFGIPLIPVGISNLVITMLNRYILDHFSDLDTVGLFSFSYRISNTLKIIILESLTLSLTPVLYKRLAEKGGKRFVQKNYVYTSFLVMSVYIFFSSFSRELIYFVAQSKAYYNAYILIPFLGLAFLFNSLNYFYNILLSYAKKTKIIAGITILSAGISIGINYLLIPLFGAYGAAGALILSAMVIFILMRYYTGPIYGAYFENFKILLILIGGLVITIINFVFFMELSIANFVIKLILCLSFPILLYLFNFYEEQEIKKLLYLLEKINLISLIKRK
jgi:O-antigen/teichoic acid export membrane protein